MYSVTKEMRFECAHLLNDHQGRCANLHGHSYKLEVTIGADKLNDAGMVMDFGLLKDVMIDIVDQFDHAFMYNKFAAQGSTEERIAQQVSSLGMRSVPFSGNTTSENLVRYIGEQFTEKLTDSLWLWVLQIKNSPRLLCARLWETATSYAEYLPEWVGDIS